MKIAVGNSRMDKRWKNKDISWEEFKNTVRTTKRTTETVSEFRKMSKAQQDSVKDVGGFVGGALREGKRRNGYVLCRSLLTLDMDYATPDIWEQIEVLYDWSCCVYSTHKSTPEAPRLRLVVPLAREVSEDEYPALGRMVAKEIGIDLFDDTTYEPSRLMYWPSTPSDGEFVFRERMAVCSTRTCTWPNMLTGGIPPCGRHQNDSRRCLSADLHSNRTHIPKAGLLAPFAWLTPSRMQSKSSFLTCTSHQQWQAATITFPLTAHPEW